LNFNDGEVADAKWVTYDEFVNYRDKEALIDFNYISLEDYKKAMEILGIEK
jgi:hypothetical protein